MNQRVENEASPDNPSIGAESVDPAEAAAQSNRGRNADKPTEIPGKGWRDVFVRVKAESKDDNVTLLAAGVAFYSLLAAVPAMAGLLSIYGLAADPKDIGDQVVSALAAAPREVRDLVTSQLESIADSSGGATFFAAILGIAVAIWSASAGVGHLMDALNVAYDEEEKRNWLRRKLVALAFTMGAILFVAVAFGVIALLPALLADTGLGVVGRVLINTLRWVVLFGGMIAGLAVLYRYGPSRDEPRWRWVSPGAAIAAGLWLVGSLVFSVYTSNFGKYNETYGSLGAIVVAMLWLFLTAAVIIIGAEINAELERQTLRDTTEGSPSAIGNRDAHAADTVGETADEVKARNKAKKAARS